MEGDFVHAPRTAAANDVAMPGKLYMLEKADWEALHAGAKPREYYFRPEVMERCTTPV